VRNLPTKVDKKLAGITRSSWGQETLQQRAGSSTGIVIKSESQYLRYPTCHNRTLRNVASVAMSTISQQNIVVEHFACYVQCLPMFTTVSYIESRDEPVMIVVVVIGLLRTRHRDNCKKNRKIAYK